MVKIDCIRHYLSRPRKIIEGFLGLKNPQLHFTTQGDKSVRLSVTGSLTTVEMYRPGQFGVNIYLPLSILSQMCQDLRATGTTPAQGLSFTRFDPAGTERGPKRVPDVLLSMGRISYSQSATAAPNSQWASQGGYLYIDLETHSADSHKRWTRNPVMEPFELHLGIRGQAVKEDPFFRTDNPLPEGVIHLTDLDPTNAAHLLARLEHLSDEIEYTFEGRAGDIYLFTLRHEDQTYEISKQFTPI